MFLCRRIIKIVKKFSVSKDININLIKRFPSLGASVFSLLNLFGIEVLNR